MGNCLAHEPRKNKSSRSTCAVAPLEYQTIDKPAKKQPPQPAAAARVAQSPCKRDKTKLKVHFADDVVFVAHEPRKNKSSRSTCAVAPLEYQTIDKPAKKKPPQPAAAARVAQSPCKRDKTKLKVHFADDVVFDHSAKKRDSVTKVKMVMTKKDAALLLSLLAGAGNQSALESMICELEAAQSLARPEVTSSPVGRCCDEFGVSV